MSSESSFSDSDLDLEYDSYLDETLNRYEEAIKVEKRLIYTTAYEFQDFSLECGLSGARDFAPVVKMVGKFYQYKHLSFTYDEWSDINQAFQELLQTEDYDKQFSLERNITMCLNIDNGNKVFQISDGWTLFQFTKHDVLEIFKINNLIFKKMQVLNNINFNVYYHNVFKTMVEALKTEISCSQHISANAVINILSAICFCNTSVENYCLLECLYYLNDKVLYDLEKYIDF